MHRDIVSFPYNIMCLPIIFLSARKLFGQPSSKNKALQIVQLYDKNITFFNTKKLILKNPTKRSVPRKLTVDNKNIRFLATYILIILVINSINTKW
jgi:hypothetical protein